MTDRDGGNGEPNTRERTKALALVVLGAIIVTALLIWFAFAFVFSRCCVSPSQVVSAPPGQASPSPAPTIAATPTATVSVVPGTTQNPDASAALDLARRFETARAAGRWSDAWALLSADSQATIGSLDVFETEERAYNASGGTVFEIQDPSQDPDLVATFLGANQVRIASEADTSRGWLVFIRHPGVQAASAGTTALYVAPLASGEWRIWIVH